MATIASDLDLTVIEVEELPDIAERRRERDRIRHAEWRDRNRDYIQAYDRWMYRQKHIRYCPDCDIDITASGCLRCTRCAIERDRALATARYRAKKRKTNRRG
jgi:hypothetical protein